MRKKETGDENYFKRLISYRINKTNFNLKMQELIKGHNIPVLIFYHPCKIFIAMRQLKYCSHLWSFEITSVARIKKSANENTCNPFWG